MGLVVGFAAVAASLAFGSALGAQLGPRLAVAPASGSAGQTVAVRGYGFRPGTKGLVVVVGTRRAVSFRAGARGRFLVRVVVPAGTKGPLRIVAERTVRRRRGSSRRLRLAGARFRVLPLGPDSSVVGSPSAGSPASAAVGSAAGSASGSGGASGASAPAPKEAPKETPGEAPKEEPKSKEAPKEEPKGKEAPKEAPKGSRWVPPQHLTWYWQLQGTVNNAEPVAAYDIDGFENTAAEVATLHAKGIHVICYIDVGTYEPGRPDTSSFPASVLGSGVEGWPGEQWLDVRQLAVLEPIMTKRFEMCKEKGFDAVETDNMDGYENSTGFPITAAEQATYDEWVATEVHSLGMAVLQKNDGEQTAQLEPYFDGALDEQCNQYSECSNFQAYLSAGKPVLNAEYELATSAFCAADNAAGIMGARYDLELDGKTFEPCW
jgi:hypothetical protein